MLNIKKNNINLKDFLEYIYNINSIITLNEWVNDNIINNKYKLNKLSVIRIINMFYIEYYDEIINNKKIFVNIMINIINIYYNINLKNKKIIIYDLLNNKLICNNYNIILEIIKNIS